MNKGAGVQRMTFEELRSAIVRGDVPDIIELELVTGAGWRELEYIGTLGVINEYLTVELSGLGAVSVRRDSTVSVRYG